MTRHRSTDLKKAVIDYYFRMKQKSIHDTAEVFQLPDETVRRWIKQYNKTGEIDNNYRQAVSYKVTQEHFDFIKKYLVKHKDAHKREPKRREPKKSIKRPPFECHSL